MLPKRVLQWQILWKNRTGEMWSLQGKRCLRCSTEDQGVYHWITSANSIPLSQAQLGNTLSGTCLITRNFHGFVSTERKDELIIFRKLLYFFLFFSFNVYYARKKPFQEKERKANVFLLLVSVLLLSSWRASPNNKQRGDADCASATPTAASQSAIPVLPKQRFQVRSSSDINQLNFSCFNKLFKTI